MTEAFCGRSSPTYPLLNAVNECLRKSPYPAIRELSCDCDQDVVVLRGRLPSFYQKQLAQEAVSHVHGVREIVNEIEVAA